MDRIDLHGDVPAVSMDELQKRTASVASDEVRRRVEAARERMLCRQEKANALLDSGELEQYANMDDDGKSMLLRAIAKLGLSARSYHRTIEVARSIADLAASGAVTRAHVAEALAYRHTFS